MSRWEDLLKESQSMNSAGGSAFPFSIVFEDKHLVSSGMSLRDFFAVQAIQGILAYSGDIGNGSAHNNGTPETNAAYAYAIADAMLIERKK